VKRAAISSGRTISSSETFKVNTKEVELVIARSQRGRQIKPPQRFDN